MSDSLKKMLVCFIYIFLFKKMSDSLIPSFLMSDVSESLRSLTKNERMSEFPALDQFIHEQDRIAPVDLF